MTRLLYNLTLHFLVAPLLVTYYGPQILLGGKYRRSIGGKLGKLPSGLDLGLKQGPRIWFHAVSVGEVVALAPLVEKISASRPDLETVVSTGTETGQQRARELIGGKVRFLYMPLDFPFSVKRVVNAVKPDLFVMTETEIWPNLIHELKRSGSRIALVNGRISDRSFPRYLKFRRFFRDTLNLVDLFSMCSDEDASRITRMGAGPGRVTVTGNIKIDSAFRDPGQDVQQGLRKLYDLSDSDQVIMAGSIHPIEDDIVIESYRRLLEKYPGLILLVAPRHLENVKSIVKKIQNSGLGTPLIKSELESRGRENGNKIIIIDRMGELFDSYSVASAVFVGGSLVPRGGQNILEPASWAKPIIFGPHMEDFRDSRDILLRNKAAIRVENVDELTRSFDLLLADRQRAQNMGETGYNQLRKHVGSAAHTFRLVIDLLEDGPNR